MENPRIVGHIVSIQGLRVRVELLPETKSAYRTTPDGTTPAVAINAYLTFSLGAGEVVIGIITDLEARESYDPTTGEELSLELLKARRIASVQILGTISGDRDLTFSPGISVLPTLDTPAEIGAPNLLRAVFETPPRRNRPEDFGGGEFDYDLKIGVPAGRSDSVVRASFNDLFSRPLAIVGNTGSGKSYTVSTLIQKAMDAVKDGVADPHIFILDINGEYERAFPSTATENRTPDRIYLNGEEFGIPLWFFNAEEICAWLSAAEQTQEPVLKDWWAIAKGGEERQLVSVHHLLDALSSLDHLQMDLSKLSRRAAGSYCDAIISHLRDVDIDLEPFNAMFSSHRAIIGFNQEVVGNAGEIAAEARRLTEQIKAMIAAQTVSRDEIVRTADSPLFIPKWMLDDPTLVNRAVPREDNFRVESHLTTLKLRLRTRIDDRRWRSFLNHNDIGTSIDNVRDWFNRIGVGRLTGPRVSVIDLSMLSNEVLPYACAVFGRILLEARERLPASSRFNHPWSLVLEEAHNYARPPRTDEDRGHRLARLTFERVAKEGRKFGLSLIIASQRPSEISQTIISQCANFICHRLQNPDDIDHFRRIIPLQARRLLDQVTILDSGEAIVFGSAFHIPARVHIDRPTPGPHSQTAAPYYEWANEKNAFPLARVMSDWGL
jgi:Helicase HerA, central domain